MFLATVFFTASFIGGLFKTKYALHRSEASRVVSYATWRCAARHKAYLGGMIVALVPPIGVFFRTWFRTWAAQQHCTHKHLRQAATENRGAPPAERIDATARKSSCRPPEIPAAGPLRPELHPEARNAGSHRIGNDATTGHDHGLVRAVNMRSARW